MADSGQKYIEFLSALIGGMNQRMPTAVDRANINAQEAQTLMGLERLNLQKASQDATAVHQKDIREHNQAVELANIKHREAVLGFAQYEKEANIEHRAAMLERTPVPTMIELPSDVATWAGIDENTKVSLTEFQAINANYNNFGKKVDKNLFRPFLDKKYFNKNITDASGKSIPNPDYIEWDNYNQNQAKLLMEGVRGQFPMDRLIKEITLKNSLDDQDVLPLAELDPTTIETPGFLGGGYNETHVLEFHAGKNADYPNVASIPQIKLNVGAYKRLYKKGDKRAHTVIKSLQNMGNELMRDSFYGAEFWQGENIRAASQLSMIRILHKTISGEKWEPTIFISKDAATKYPEFQKYYNKEATFGDIYTETPPEISDDAPVDTSNVIPVIPDTSNVIPDTSNVTPADSLTAHTHIDSLIADSTTTVPEEPEMTWPVSSNRPKYSHVKMNNHYRQAFKSARNKGLDIEDVLTSPPYNYTLQQIEYLKFKFD